MEGIKIEIEEFTSDKDFAKAVAKVLKDEYGTHNIEPFMEELKKELNIKN